MRESLAGIIGRTQARETHFTYDDQGRQLSRTLPLGVQTPLAPDDFIERMEYDDLGRTSLHVGFEGRVTAYVYDDQAGSGGRLSEKRYFADLAAYDDGNGTAAERTSYTYDASGRQKDVLQDRDGDLLTTGDQRLTENWYDSQGRLMRVSMTVTSVTLPNGQPGYKVEFHLENETSKESGAGYGPDRPVRQYWDWTEWSDRQGEEVTPSRSISSNWYITPSGMVYDSALQ